ncbi:replication factor C small subunit [Halobacteriales archaeon SW_10_66_29]|nr:MAG: replication factor C small subunit [Halobacteriales archaeon SW_10_66_29]
MSEAEQATGGREEIWLEKYRPQTLDEVVGHEAIIERLKSYVERDDLNHMLFAGPAGVGKCATGETPVLTDNGLVRMGEVVGSVDGFSESEGLEILTFNRNGEFEYTEPSHVFGREADELVEVETRDGASLTVTPEHKLLVIGGDGLTWQQASEIDAGARIVRPLSAPLPDTDEKVDWISEMHGARTFVHVSPAFADRHDIPFEENLVGTKKEVIGRLRAGKSVDEIDETLDTPRKTIRSAEREFRNENLDRCSTVCSLAYLRKLGVSREELRRNVEAIEHVTRTNNRKSGRIEPPWTLSPELTEFVGLAISEARIDGGRLKFYNTDETLIERFDELARSLFAVEPRRGEEGEVSSVAISNKTLTGYLESCFDVFESAAGGTGIGSTILTADRESRRRFLRAVFDAEAHVRSNGIIEVTQKNGSHITLLSYLLAGFGIPSRRKTKRKAATNGSGIEREYHTLLVSGAPHLGRFQEKVGFSIDEKAATLAEAVDKTGNPNNDTIPRQRAVDDLCDQLYLTKREYIPETLNPETPGRERYLSCVSDLVGDASDKLEAVQEARETLSELEPLAVRKEVSETVGIDGNKLLKYAYGDHTPYANRVQRLLKTVADSESVPIETLQSELQSIIDQLHIPYRRIADGTHLRGTDVRNLLTNDDFSIKSLPRFTTVLEELDTELARMASLETLESLHALHRLSTADLYLDEVTEVRQTAEQRRVYDLTVPGSRNYVAGTVPTVMHNTTSAIAIARELYGEDWEQQFLELNASDERGIDVVRERVKSFARTSFGGPSYRIIFLDEADALTAEAQAALRRTMEQFSNNVRFILSCNYSSQIIDPIQSRCTVFRFAPLSEEAVERMVREIAEKENIEVTDDGVDALAYVAGGDMRAAINGLQAAAVTGRVVDEEAVFEITSTARPENIEEMVTRALDGDFTAARSQLNRLLTEEGIAGGDIIDQLHRSVWEFDLDDEAAVRLLDRIGEADYRITAGANERIQLEALLASVALDD